MDRLTGGGVDDLRQCRGFVAAEVSLGNNRPTHHDLAHGSERFQQAVVPCRNRIVTDADDLHGDTRHGPAEAHPVALLGQCAGLVQQQLATDVGHGQGFGGTVGRVDFNSIRQEFRHLLQHFQRGRCAGGDDPAQGAQRGL